MILYIYIKKILHENQFGFQEGKSTEHAILDLYTNIIQSIEKQEKSSCIFLDFAKGFDAVDHYILIRKLEHHGVRGIELERFKSYLSNRNQAVKIGLNQSSFQIVLSGVPQRSVLGSLLFLTYINDIYLSHPLVKFHLFADDTCIFHSCKNYSKLEQ